MRKIFLTFIFVIIAFVSFTNVFGDSLAGYSQFNNITIFIRFDDEGTYEAPYEYSHYDEMLNGVGTQSLRDYYLEVSYGQVAIDSYIPTNNGEIIFYTDTFNRNYFQPYSTENPQGVRENEQAEREHALIERALDYVDENNLIPDTMDLDVNDDQMIDSLTFMISGEDEGWNSLLWPHKWELYNSYSDNYGFTPGAPQINGVYAYYYTWELLGNSTSYYQQVDVGVLAHETFHLLSAPDLYHYYDYLDISPVGNWGLMDSVGEIPSHMLGYMKYQYGKWIDTIPEISENGSYTLYPLQDSPNNIYRINTGIEDEWIYLEYRDSDGFYESTLPDTGLLVYRVNNKVEGNEYGSYSEAGTPLDEVFVYRPYMDDVIEPIILTNDEGIDGSIDYAALSDSNNFDSIGSGSEIPLWSSEGNILDISIYNVVEHNGYITFDVFLSPTIELLSETQDITNKSVILYDHFAMDYNVELTNVPENFEAYYTLDGTTPDKTSILYDGTPISINAVNNIVTVAIYNGEELISLIDKEFTFTDVIESDHNPYGNEVTNYFYVDFGTNTPFALDFSNDSETEEDYDYIYLYINDETHTFHGTNMVDFYGNYNTEEFLLVFESDQYLDEYYGFLLDITLDEGAGLFMNGASSYTLSVGSEFNDLGCEIVGPDQELYTLNTIGSVDEFTLGTYTITYQLLDGLGDVVEEVTRTVTIIDDIAPNASLIGYFETVVEVFTTYEDLGIIYSDNYDTDLDIEIRGLDGIDTSRLGSNTITYVITDQSGNKTVLTRIVEVVDTTPPTGTIAPGIDTVYVNTEWEDSGVSATDNLSETLRVGIDGEVDTSTIGTYEITYIVADGSGNMTELTRIVTVIEDTSIEYSVTCNSMITTLTEGDTLIVKPCFIDGEIMNVDSPETIEVGIHEMIYYKEIDGITYYYKIYYVVLSNSDPVLHLENDTRRREEDE